MLKPEPAVYSKRKASDNLRYWAFFFFCHLSLYLLINLLCLPIFVPVNKHKPWIETTYHGIVTENDDNVLLDPPLIVMDKDAPLRYAGKEPVSRCFLAALPKLVLTGMPNAP